MKEDNIDYDVDFEIVEKEFTDIINDIDFKDEDEKLLCESIIDHIEQSIAIGLKEMKTVQLPYIGTLRIDPVKKQIKENKEAFKAARRNMTKDQYKEYVKEYIYDIKEEQKEKDFNKVLLKKIKANNKEKYEQYYKLLGRPYAEAFIFCISLLTYVPYDKEWEEWYQSLKD